MIGASIYLSQPLQRNLNYIKNISKYGIKLIFTSMHIPEENPSETLQQISKIAAVCEDIGIELMVDISSSTFEIFNVEDTEIIDFLTQLNIKSLRLDYGFSPSLILDLQKTFNLYFNASTIDGAYCDTLEEEGIEFSAITACHNFYPRKDTGLSRESLLEKNNFLKSKGFKIQAFIPGDETKRGPLYEGLPTVEEHRSSNPLASYIDLTENLMVDEVLVGDVSMSKEGFEAVRDWIENSLITLVVSNASYEYSELLPEIMKNRKDSARNVFRHTKSRTELNNHNIAKADNLPRPIGTITIDNDYYGRYKGEIQITLVDLGVDERVNVIGNIRDEDLDLLKYINGDSEIKLKGR